MAESYGTDRRDWASRKFTWVLLWGLPWGALIVSIFVGPKLRTAIWPASLLCMGVACLTNASRCGRMHCYFTGPFFLLVAAASLLHGLEIVPLGPYGWRWMGITLLIGAGILHYLPELVWGKYVPRTSSS